MKSNRLFLTCVLAVFVYFLQSFCTPNMALGQDKSDSLTMKEVPKPLYELHYIDLGIGFGLDYGGLIGVKIGYLPIPYLSVFVAGGYYLFGFGWNVGVTGHILPSSSRYHVRPNIKVMYGVNGGTMVAGTTEYYKMFTGVTPGVGLELMFGRHKKNGIDIDINFPIHGPDYYKQYDTMKNDPRISELKEPLPVAFSIGFHHEF